MGLTRREKLLRDKIRYLTAKIAHRPRAAILRAMQATMTNQLKAEIAADRRKVA